MRDDSQRWDAPLPPDYAHSAKGITLTRTTLARQVVVSGPRVLTQIEGPVAEWPGIVTGQSYALCLRTDRVLLVNGPPLSEGWHEGTDQAVSDASDAYAVVDISGPRSLEVLTRGAELSLQHPSKSVARLLFGLGVFLYRHDSEDRFRIHVPSSQADALIQSIKGAMAAC
ncbi:hypothetical protein O4H61_01695 [Roseovarius aestuarii]|nr:hypothetical protein [Roseovarius aestuarii]